MSRLATLLNRLEKGAPKFVVPEEQVTVLADDDSDALYVVARTFSASIDETEVIALRLRL